VTRVPVLAVGRSGLLYDAVRALAHSERYRVAAVITDEAYPEYDVDADAFRDLAAEVRAEFLTTRRITAELVAGLVRRHRVQVGISANWRFLIPGGALRELPQGILNLHLGRLPDYKGNATVNWAIVNGEPDICADVHRMVPDLDAGDVLARATMPLGSETYVGDVLDWSRAEAPGLFLAALDRAVGGSDEVVVRGSTDGLRCYPRLPEDGAIDWSRSAEQVGRLVRASSRPYPGSLTIATAGTEQRRLLVWRAHPVPYPERFLAVPGQVLAVDQAGGTVDVACGKGVLRLEEVEVDGEAVRPSDAVRSIRTRFHAPHPALEAIPA